MIPNRLGETYSVSIIKFCYCKQLFENYCLSDSKSVYFYDKRRYLEGFTEIFGKSLWYLGRIFENFQNDI